MYFDEKQSANKCPLAVQLQRITDLDMHDHMLDHCDNVNKIMISVIWPNRNWYYSIYPSLDRDGYKIDLGQGIMIGTYLPFQGYNRTNDK